MELTYFKGDSGVCVAKGTFSGLAGLRSFDASVCATECNSRITVSCVGREHRRTQAKRASCSRRGRPTHFRKKR
ncbi:MAG TPA: hypothetical protein VMX74_01935, partial [Pirellulales bacterium]|nr:hypothetical protein [Pirellulales bacterium]